MERINFVNLILGRRGSGKTHYTNELIRSYNKARPEMKILIVDTFENPGYKHILKISPQLIKAWKKPGSIYKVYYNDMELILSEISKNLYNTLIIFEDSTKYIKKTIQDNVRKFIIDSKQKNLDVIFIFHGFASTPPELFRLSDTITMFKTDNPVYRKSDLIEFDQIYKTYLKIQNSKNPYEKITIQL